MLKKSLFIGTFFLLFIGLSDYGYGCHGGKPPHTGCGGVVDGLKANLTGGTFVLDNPVIVNLDKKGRIFTSGDILSMTQPSDFACSVSGVACTMETECTEDDEDTCAANPLLGEWNAVFEACQETMPLTLKIPTEINFKDDWRIAANAGLILLRLFDARVVPKAEISLTLLGDSFDYEDNPIPPDDGTISQFEINRWSIFGDSERGVRPPESCHVEGDLWFPSMLTICGKNVRAEDCHPPTVD